MRIARERLSDMRNEPYRLARQIRLHAAYGDWFDHRLSTLLRFDEKIEVQTGTSQRRRPT